MMKILMSLIAIVMLTKECDKNNSVTTIEKETITEKVSENNQEYEKITYQAFSRAGFEKTSITKQSVTIMYNKNLKDLKKIDCPEKEWNELMSLLNSIDVKSLPDLKAPTDKRLYDGAPHASLILQQNENEITCGTFDHGFPPKDIEALVNKVLSIKEMMLKQ